MEQEFHDQLDEPASGNKGLAEVCKRIVAAAATFEIGCGQLGLQYNLPIIFEKQHIYIYILYTLW